MNLAIVHDGLATFGGRGGAEWVLMVLHEMFPQAPIYTTVYNSERMPTAFQQFDIRPSWIQRLPWGTTSYKAYLPLMPTAVEQLDLSGYEVVLSCNHSVAKGVVTSPDTLHLCYCYTPLRYAWDMYHEYLDTSWNKRIARLGIPPLLTYLRLWDVLSSNRVDAFIAISRYVARRIWKYYRRQSVVIYPPVDTARFTVSSQLDPYFLIVSRLEPYKRIDLAVEAFNRLGRPLVIIGDGTERKKLVSLANKNITLVGRQSDEVVRTSLSRCQALIFPGEEDFGITPVEAQASGRPVIAYRGGGALETVTEHTGQWFFPKTVDALVAAVEHFDASRFDSQAIQQHARQFDIAVFRQKVTQLLDAYRVS
ncbi:glycosyltransferase [candidate division KSB3 bacterium]|uniref:Glycosyltransferase n=1 Tax=candidate division KSB3 bacterium TaxID=2044937 RepID=A0A9D5JRJ3_9BACT|nr:glycosyltransferase [candidate division KSB3 bacterium]MBD3322959.1 glycosyltransferase [candidate division KSB3 bacterium]